MLCGTLCVMLLLYSVVEAVSGMAISLGVGSSTFALIFYFMGKHSAVFHETGRPYQKVVYRVLRVAMVLILLTEIIKGTLYVQTGTSVKELFESPTLVFIWTIIVVLFGNAILMTLHLMTRKLGPAIQATSWYTLGTVAALPGGVVTFTYLPLLLTYAGCILAFAVIIELITQKVTPKETFVQVSAVTDTVASDTTSS